jgi:hypothetical protein
MLFVLVGIRCENDSSIGHESTVDTCLVCLIYHVFSSIQFSLIYWSVHVIVKHFAELIRIKRAGVMKNEWASLKYHSVEINVKLHR